jgi:hypothetical protein
MLPQLQLSGSDRGTLVIERRQAMKKMRWQPGSVVRKRLNDSWTYYARLLEFPWVAFYRYRTKEPFDDVAKIVGHEVLFTIAAHKDLLAPGEWETVGLVPLEPTLHPPGAQAIWDDADHCQIIDRDGNIRPATPKECAGLEPAAVWEPEHIADRLQDAFAGRQNRWLRELIPRRTRRG